MGAGYPLGPETAEVRYGSEQTQGSPSLVATGFRSPAPDTAYAHASNQDMFTAALTGLVDGFDLGGEQLGAVIGGAVLKAQPGLQSDAGMRAGLGPLAVHPGLRSSAGVRNRFAGRHRRRRRNRRRPVRGGRGRRVDTTSDAPIGLGDTLRRSLLALRRSTSTVDRLKLLGRAARDARRGDPDQR